MDKEGEETGKLELAIDGVTHTKYPYISIDFGKCQSRNHWFKHTDILSLSTTNCVFDLVAEDQKQQIMQAGIRINDVIVFDAGESETWSSAMFRQRSLKRFGDGLVTSLEIERVKQTTEVTNELFDAVLKLDTPQTGLDKFTMYMI